MKGRASTVYMQSAFPTARCPGASPTCEVKQQKITAARRGGRSPWPKLRSPQHSITLRDERDSPTLCPQKYGRGWVEPLPRQHQATQHGSRNSTDATPPPSHAPQLDRVPSARLPAPLSPRNAAGAHVKSPEGDDYMVICCGGCYMLPSWAVWEA